MSNYISFNLNQYVRVKLTDAGREWHQKRHEKFFGRQLKYIPPKEDENGWSCWQMHSLMNTFGEGVGMGCTLLFETTIELDIVG